MINKGVFISHRRVCLFHTVQAVLNNSFLTPGRCAKLVNSHRPWMGGVKRPLFHTFLPGEHYKDVQ